MPTDPMNKSSESNRPDRIPTYVEKFGSPFPEPQLVRYAANHQAMELLHEMLQERADANEPVMDWDAFGREFRGRVELEFAKQLRNNMGTGAVEGAIAQ